MMSLSLLAGRIVVERIGFMPYVTDPICPILNQFAVSDLVLCCLPISHKKMLGVYGLSLYPGKLCLWRVYCFHVVRPCVSARDQFNNKNHFPL